MLQAQNEPQGVQVRAEGPLGRRPVVAGATTLGRVFGVAFGLVVGGGIAVAPRGAAAQDSPAPKVKVERTASGQKVFRITEGIVVEGKIQKPNAFYVLQRSSIDYDWESLKQDFLPKILKATTQHPF